MTRVWSTSCRLKIAAISFWTRELNNGFSSRSSDYLFLVLRFNPGRWSNRLNLLAAESCSSSTVFVSIPLLSVYHCHYQASRTLALRLIHVNSRMIFELKLAVRGDATVR